ncbi:Protein EFR3 like [Schistosoma japonicum]|nr:Protein EFR3 like [Schistosoma japonicum]
MNYCAAGDLGMLCVKSTCFKCGPCRPKWMKMVDNLYSGNPQDTNNHNKLIHYCLHQPDKLDRIAKYLHLRLSQDLSRRYDQNLSISVKAIDKLIQVKFVEFSKIDDDSPNYHKECNEILDHFAAMAHASLLNPKDRNAVRVAGIQGIQGVVRKLVSDQLILEVHESNMDKIVPALLFNMCDRSEIDPNSNESQTEPSQEAVYVFEDIVRQASYTNIKPVVASILTHLDNHHLWDPCDFPLLIFQYLLDSLKTTQVAHSLVKQLVAHLSLHESDFTLAERTSLVQVIGLVVINLAKGAIGPDVFHNFKSLLQILKASIDKTSQISDSEQPSLFNDSNRKLTGERQFQEAIINTIAEFAKNLPDTQKIEILKFILNFEPMVNYHPEYGDRPKPLIMVLLQTMLTVATQYKTVAISNALNSDFLNLLLRGVAIDPDPVIRIIVQKILHTLIDRHGNTEQLLTVRIYGENELSNYFVLEKPERQDILFMKKAGVLFIENIYHQLLDPSNKVDNLEYLSCTVGLVALEMGAEQVITELFRLILAVQTKIIDENTYMPLTHRCALHALLASTITLLVQLINLKLFNVDEMLHPGYYPPLHLTVQILWIVSNFFPTSCFVNSYPSEFEVNDDLLFSSERITESLVSAGYDITVLSIPYNPIYLRLYDGNSRDPLADSSVYPRVGGSEHCANQQSYGVVADDKNSAIGNVTSSGCIESLYLNGTMLCRKNSQSGTGFVQSGSSFSLTDSLYSVADSTNMVDEFLSFKNMRKLVVEGEEVQKPSKLFEEDRLLSGCFNPAEFNEICAQQREKAHSVRAHMAEVLDDLSACDLHSHDITFPMINGPKKSQGRDNIVIPLSSINDAINTKLNPDQLNNLNINASLGGGGVKPSKKLNKSSQAVWEREFASLFSV